MALCQKDGALHHARALIQTALNGPSHLVLQGPDVTRTTQNPC